MILNVFRKKLEFEKSTAFINQITINYLHDRLININKQIKHQAKKIWYEKIFRKIADAFSKKKNEKLRELAMSTFNKMYENRELDKIEKMHNFKNYEKKYYNNVHLQILEINKQYQKQKNKPDPITNREKSPEQKQYEAKKKLQEIQKIHEDGKNEIHQQIEKMTNQEMEQFINIQSQQVTRNEYAFVQYLQFLKKIKRANLNSGVEFGFEEDGSFRNGMKFEAKQILPNQQEQPEQLTYQEVLEFWNDIFKNQPNEIQFTPDSIVKTYLEHQMGNNIYYLLENQQQPSIQVIGKVKQNASIIKPNSKDYKLLDSIQKQLENTNTYNDSEIEERIKIIRKNLANLLICHKQGFTKESQMNPFAQVIKELSKKAEETYYYNKRTTVINIYQMDRVVFLIRSIVVDKNQPEQIYQLIYDTLFANTSQFLFNIFKDYPENRDIITQQEKDKKEIAKKVQEYYQVCSKKIAKELIARKPQEIFGSLKINQQNFIQSIIVYQQKLLSNQIKQLKCEYIFNKDIEDEKPEFQFVYQCIKNAMNQIEFELNDKMLKQTLLKQSEKKIKGEQKKNKTTVQKEYENSLVRKYTRCKDDYIFVQRFLKNIAYIEAYRLNRCAPFLDIRQMLKTQLEQIDKQKDVKKYYIWKKNFTAKIIKYFGDLNSFNLQKDQESILPYLKLILLELHQFSKPVLLNQHIDLSKQKQRLKGKFAQISAVIEEFVKLKEQNSNLKDYIEDIKKILARYHQPYQVHRVETASINQNVYDLSRLFLQMASNFNRKCEALFSKNKYELEQNDIEDIYFLGFDFFKCVSNVEKNVLDWNRKHFWKYNDRKFQILIHSIDKEFLTDSTELSIANRFYQVINQQICGQARDKARKEQLNLVPQPSKVPYSQSQIENQKMGRKQNDLSSESSNISQHQIHLVLEGYGSSHLYFEDYAKILRKTISKMSFESQQNSPHRMDITAITSSNFHSVFGFLYALGLQGNQIRNQMTKIRSIARVYQRNINQTFDDYKWTTCTPSETKQCLKYIWQDNLNSFEQFKDRLNSKVDLKEQTSQMRRIYLAEKEQTLEYCDKILGNLAELVSKNIPQEVYEERKTILSKELGLKYQCSQNQTHDYSQFDTNSTELVKTMTGMCFSMFSSLAEMVVTENPLLKTLIQITEENRTQIWKGIIIKKLFSTYKLKEYIQQKLEERKLNRSTTLQQFYEVSDRKVLLTFTAVNTTANKLEFINKNTYPNMPVWAAILAASSMPYLYSEFEAVKQWANHSTKLSCIRAFKNSFFETEDEKKQKKLKFSSANIISSVPLDLLTNQTVLNSMFLTEQNEKTAKDKSKKQSKYIFVPITFDTREFAPKKKKNQLVRRYVTVSSIASSIDIKLAKNLLFESSKVCSSNAHKNKLIESSAFSMAISKFSKILGLSSSIGIMELFVNSNDNLIMQLYKDKVIKCPIKIDTLDFNQITYQQKGLDMPTDKTLETIERSKFITKQFIRQGDCQEKKIHFRIEMFTEEDNQGLTQKFYENKQLIKCKIVFLSYSKWNKSEQKLLKIQYSVQMDTNKKIDCTEEIVLAMNENGNRLLFLDFYYPDNRTTNIIHNQFKLNLLSLYKEYKQGAKKNPQTSKFIRYDYEFGYGKIRYTHQKTLKPIKKYREKIVQNDEPSGYISLVTNFEKFYRNKEPKGFMCQLRKDIEVDIQNNLGGIHPQSGKNVLKCRNCSQKLKLVLTPKDESTELKQLGIYQWKCDIDDKPVCKLVCSNKKCKATYCLKCFRHFLIERQKYRNKCLLCSYRPISDPEQNSTILHHHEAYYGQDREPKLTNCSFCGQLKHFLSLTSCKTCKIKICDICIGDI